MVAADPAGTAATLHAAHTSRKSGSHRPTNSTCCLQGPSHSPATQSLPMPCRHLMVGCNTKSRANFLAMCHWTCPEHGQPRWCQLHRPSHSAYRFDGESPVFDVGIRISPVRMAPCLLGWRRLWSRGKEGTGVANTHLNIQQCSFVIWRGRSMHNARSHIEYARKMIEDLLTRNWGLGLLLMSRRFRDVIRLAVSRQVV